MSTLMKWLIMLLAWLAFSVITFRACVKDSCCIACNAETQTEEVTPPPGDTSITMRYPVSSKLGTATVESTDKFAAWKDEIVAGMKDGQILEVEGIYYASEAAPEGMENMGLARAQNTIDLLSAFIPKDRMRPVARLVQDDSDVGDGYFLAAKTRWVTEEDNDTEEVISISEDEKIILFPNASAQEIRDPGVLTYLDDLAAHLKANPEDKVQVTGHASRTGNADDNMRFSRERAERVRSMLTERGVDTSQITIDFKGDTQLRDSGTTEAAHRNNRRAELKLIRSGN